MIQIFTQVVSAALMVWVWCKYRLIIKQSDLRHERDRQRIAAAKAEYEAAAAGQRMAEQQVGDLSDLLREIQDAHYKLACQFMGKDTVDKAISSSNAQASRWWKN